jgi:hypothetical protein
MVLAHPRHAARSKSLFWMLSCLQCSSPDISWLTPSHPSRLCFSMKLSDQMKEKNSYPKPHHSFPVLPCSIFYFMALKTFNSLLPS